jgi:hypothetical protein
MNLRPSVQQPLPMGAPLSLCHPACPGLPWNRSEAQWTCGSANHSWVCFSTELPWACGPPKVMKIGESSDGRARL